MTLESDKGAQLGKLRQGERLTWTLGLNLLSSSPAPHSGTPLQGPSGRLEPTLTGLCRPPVSHSQKPLQNGEEAESFEKEAEVALNVPSSALHSFLLATVSSSTAHRHLPLNPFPSWASPL